MSQELEDSLARAVDRLTLKCQRQEALIESLMGQITAIQKKVIAAIQEKNKFEERHGEELLDDNSPSNP